ncbi:MAG: DUF1207 domain-containing protein [Elusimicrobia bacterium]|nr:DUF1207 domain-containing protein [Candidatus Liberimonas magnetica]
MKKILLLFVFLSVLSIPILAEGQAQFITGLAPPPDELFVPLLADPRELHFALRMAFPQKDGAAAEVAIGHYYGIYRWAFSNDRGAVQVNIGGGIFPRFNFANNRDLQVIDFYGNIPFDVRLNKWSGRFMVYHVSSHLGDDYIRTSGQIASSNSWNSLRSILSYDINSALRLYGGYTYHLLVYPPEQKKHTFQSGFELTSNFFGNGYAKAYWANDMQWWERTDMKAQFNSQIGIKVGRKSKNGRSISYFLEYTTGPEYYGQLFKREETRVGIGVKFAIN